MMVQRPLGRYWVILHKPTGGTLPELKRPVHGGYTHTEPCCNEPPRLFMSARDARNALTWWLRGVLTVHITAGDPFAFDPEPSEDFVNTPVATRKAEDMDVIPVSLSEIVQEIA